MKDAVKALIRDDQGKILVLFRSETHPHLAHDIDLPGGEIDESETLEDTLIREIQEETGLIIKTRPGQQVHAWMEIWGTKQYLYDLGKGSGGEVMLSWEHKSYSWMNEEDFINYPAKDEFMHKAQEWLRSNTEEVEIQGSTSAVHLAGAL